jgi:hypothetical protein
MLQGSPIAVNRVIDIEWPKLQKVMVRRISQREFNANTPRTMLGYGYKYHGHEMSLNRQHRY